MHTNVCPSWALFELVDLGSCDEKASGMQEWKVGVRVATSGEHPEREFAWMYFPSLQCCPHSSLHQEAGMGLLCAKGCCKLGTKWQGGLEASFCTAPKGDCPTFWSQRASAGSQRGLPSSIAMAPHSGIPIGQCRGRGKACRWWKRGWRHCTKEGGTAQAGVRCKFANATCCTPAPVAAAVDLL